MLLSRKECYAIVLEMLPHKLKDLGCFTTPTLWALMTTHILRSIELQPTNISLHLANRTITHPRGIVEDILKDDTVPIILGQPFFCHKKGDNRCREGRTSLKTM
ncbi:hypothetical protein CR513_26481, partial [Mucuna pruriens]